MITLDKPDIATRITALAQRMGFDGPDASEKVLDVALEYLEDSVTGRPRWRTRQHWDVFSQQRAADLARQGHAEGLDEPSSGSGKR